MGESLKSIFLEKDCGSLEAIFELIVNHNLTFSTLTLSVVDVTVVVFHSHIRVNQPNLYCTFSVFALE